METVPKPVLHLILAQVGSFDEVLMLTFVCKTWKNLIETNPLFFELESTRRICLYPRNLVDEDFFSRASNFKLREISLMGTLLKSSVIARVVASQPYLEKLNLTSTEVCLGELWSCISSKLQKDTLALKELRITNSKSLPCYDSMKSVFPKLEKLYSGNTKTNYDDIYKIIAGFRHLKLLDISYCSMESAGNFNLNEINSFMSETSLELIFATNFNDKILEFFMQCGVEVVGVTIGELLNELKSQEDLCNIKDFIKMGGDVNVHCNQFQTAIVNSITVYPQMNLLTYFTDEDLTVETYKVLIGAGLDLSFHSETSTHTILISAIRFGFPKLADLLLRNGADVWPVLESGSNEIPAFHEAIKKGKLSILKSFTKYGLHKKSRNKHNYCSPYCEALRKGNLKALEFLLSEGFIIDTCQNHTNIFLLKSVTPQILKLIFEKEIQIEDLAQKLYSAAQFFFHKQKFDNVSFFLARLKEIDAFENEKAILEEVLVTYSRKSSFFSKPLLVLAAETNNEECIHKLVRLGCDLNITDKFGWTPLFAACSMGHSSLVSYFIGNGCLINSRDSFYRTPLHQASHNGHLETVKELVKFGAALSPVDKKGYSPLDLAILNGHQDIEEYLRAQGASVKKGKRFKICSIF